MSLSLKSQNASYPPFQILVAVGSLQPLFLISPMNSSHDIPIAAASS